MLFRSSNGKEHLDKFDKEEVENHFNELSDEEKEKIINAGEEAERIDNAKNTPLNELTDEEFEEIKNHEADNANYDPDKIENFEELSDKDKYDTFVNNGLIPNNSSESNVNTSNSNPIHVNELSENEFKETNLGDLDYNEIQSASERLTGEGKAIFDKNIEHASFEDIKGKSIEELQSERFYDEE